MLYVFRILVFFLDPLGLWRQLVFRPVLKFVTEILKRFNEKTNEKIAPLKEFVLRLGLIAFAVIFIIWLAVFMYVSFYYFYMPALSHTRPVHMQFKNCSETSEPCVFPHAHVSLTKKQQLLMFGQAYRVIVNIEMPESPQNLDLGMFMVCAELRDHTSMLRGHSCRASMLRYHSPIVRSLKTWIWSPLYILGLKEEFQRVPVEIFTTYLEERHHPITDVFVEIQSQKIQFYSVTLHIVADFTGLRYIMFNFPVLSAIVAISSNLFFILMVFLLSWYHWSDTAWLHNFQTNYAILTKDDVNTDQSLQDDEILTLSDEKSTSSDIENLSGGSEVDNNEDLTKKTLKKRKILQVNVAQ